MAAIYGVNLIAADFGAADMVMLEIASRSRLTERPRPDEVIFGLDRAGLLPGRVPILPIEDWWSYCPDCLGEDQARQREIYVRSSWCHPLAFACGRHQTHLRSWPPGLEIQGLDGKVSFKPLIETDLRKAACTGVETHIATLLSKPGVGDWDALAVAALDVADALLARTGFAGDGTPALFEFVPRESLPRVAGAVRLPLHHIANCEAHVRLVLLSAIAVILAFDDERTPRTPEWLKEMVRANARRPGARDLASASADPLFLLMARLNPSAANALAARSEGWPAAHRRRMGTAVVVGALANNA